VPPHIVREIVGPCDIEVTMTIYAHATLDEKRASLRKLGMPWLRTLPQRCRQSLGRPGASRSVEAHCSGTALPTWIATGVTTSIARNDVPTAETFEGT
jgi:hypothetical protein